jgi:DNA modification methylase
MDVLSGKGWRLYVGDAVDSLKQMPDQCIDTCVTSPPYWGLRDYGTDSQFGLEATPDEYVARLTDVFEQAKRVLRDDGALWLNLGDSYAGSGGAGTRFSRHGIAASGVVAPSTYKDSRYKPPRALLGLKPKDLIGIPWRVAFALQSSGWYLRQDIIWHKPNPMPESVKDRCTKSHEYIFLLSKNKKYYFDHEIIKEPAAYAGQSRGGSTNRYEQNKAGMDKKVYNTRNKRSVWSVTCFIQGCSLRGIPRGVDRAVHIGRMPIQGNCP